MLNPITEVVNELDDDLLVASYLKGELRSFDSLYERYRQKVYAYVIKNVGQRYADEVFQDVWVKILVGVERYAEKGKFRSWLFTFAHNTVADHYRKWGEEKCQPLSGYEQDKVNASRMLR